MGDFPQDVMDEAEAEARRRFDERAEEFREDLESSCFEVLPGNHSPADVVLLAHLMTATDGYNHIQLIQDWERRRKSGWQTCVCFLADVGAAQTVRFALEVRYNELSRQLAILIDWNSPGERVPYKIEQEKVLLSLGFRVLSITESEILSQPEECRLRVEHILVEMNEDILTDAGAIRGRIRE